MEHDLSIHMAFNAIVWEQTLSITYYAAHVDHPLGAIPAEYRLQVRNYPDTARV